MKSKAIVFFVSVLFTFISIKPILSQNRAIKYIYNERNVSLPIAIVFTDTIASKSDTFDIIKNNPFNDLKYNVIQTDFWGWKAYSFSKEAYNKLNPYSQRAKYEPETETNANSTDYLIGGTYLSSGFDNHTSNIVIAYSFLVSDASDELYIGATSIYFIINRNGKVVKTSKPLGVNINEIVISDDNKYVGFHYGAEMNNKYIKSGVRIYDVKTDSVIFDYFLEDPTIGYFVEDKLVCFSRETSQYNENLTYSVYFMDASSKEIGKYVFKNDEWLNIGDFNRDSKGLHFLYNGKQHSLLFNKDFNKIEVK